jgi:hypothetical protein
MHLRRAIGVALVLTVIIGCAAPPARVAYNSISAAEQAAVNAATGYKRSCGVPPGGDGPGTCEATKYMRVEAAFTAFQGRMVDAVDIASKSGSTPLEVISAAAASVLQAVAEAKK